MDSQQHQQKHAARAEEGPWPVDEIQGETSLVVVEDRESDASLMPRLLGSVTDIEANMKVFREFVHRQMVENEDYMVFAPGRAGAEGKKNLLKPGAEKLLTYHGYGVEFTMDKDSSYQDFDPMRPFLRFVYRARVYDKRTGKTVVEGVDGEANSYEERYYFTNKGSWELSAAEKEAAERGAYQRIERPRKDGSGKVILYRVPNPPEVIFGFANTLRKMALKRALVPATIMACRASGVFTQDLEHPETIPGMTRPPKKSVATTTKPLASYEVIAVVRGLAQKLGLNAAGINAVCQDKCGKPWVSVAEDGARAYPCNQQEAETLVLELHRLLDEEDKKPKAPAKAAEPAAENDQTSVDTALEDLLSGDGGDE